MSRSEITIQLPREAERYRAAIERVTIAGLARTGRESASISVALVDETAMRKLHRQHLGETKATDVLAFPVDEALPDGSDYLGDVVICLPQAVAQAKRAGHPVESELMLLTAHGVLHLAGFDHGTDKAREIMWQMQREVLQTVDSQVLEPQEE